MSWTTLAPLLHSLSNSQPHRLNLTPTTIHPTNLVRTSTCLAFLASQWRCYGRSSVLRPPPQLSCAHDYCTHVSGHLTLGFPE